MECDIVTIDEQETYETLKEGMLTQNYWVRFFMRPCCPPPGEETARHLIDHLKSDIDRKADLTDEQRADLKAIIDARLDWYLALPLRRTA